MSFRLPIGVLKRLVEFFDRFRRNRLAVDQLDVLPAGLPEVGIGRGVCSSLVFTVHEDDQRVANLGIDAVGLEGVGCHFEHVDHLLYFIANLLFKRLFLAPRVQELVQLLHRLVVVAEHLTVENDREDSVGRRCALTHLPCACQLDDLGRNSTNPRRFESGIDRVIEVGTLVRPDDGQTLTKACCPPLPVRRKQKGVEPGRNLWPAVRSPEEPGQLI